MRLKIGTCKFANIQVFFFLFRFRTLFVVPNASLAIFLFVYFFVTIFTGGSIVIYACLDFILSIIFGECRKKEISSTMPLIGERINIENRWFMIYNILQCYIVPIPKSISIHEHIKTYFGSKLYPSREYFDDSIFEFIVNEEISSGIGNINRKELCNVLKNHDINKSDIIKRGLIYQIALSHIVGELGIYTISQFVNHVAHNSTKKILLGIKDYGDAVLKNKNIDKIFIFDGADYAEFIDFIVHIISFVFELNDEVSCSCCNYCLACAGFCWGACGGHCGRKLDALQHMKSWSKRRNGAIKFFQILLGSIDEYSKKH